MENTDRAAMVDVSMGWSISAPTPYYYKQCSMPTM